MPPVVPQQLIVGEKRGASIESGSTGRGLDSQQGARCERAGKTRVFLPRVFRPDVKFLTRGMSNLASRVAVLQAFWRFRSPAGSLRTSVGSLGAVSCRISSSRTHILGSLKGTLTSIPFAKIPSAAGICPYQPSGARASVLSGANSGAPKVGICRRTEGKKSPEAFLPLARDHVFRKN